MSQAVGDKEEGVDLQHLVVGAVCIRSSWVLECPKLFLLPKKERFVWTGQAPQGCVHTQPRFLPLPEGVLLLASPRLVPASFPSAPWSLTY